MAVEMVVRPAALLAPVVGIVGSGALLLNVGNGALLPPGNMADEIPVDAILGVLEGMTPLEAVPIVVTAVEMVENPEIVPGDEAIEVIKLVKKGKVDVVLFSTHRVMLASDGEELAGAVPVGPLVGRLVNSGSAEVLLLTG